MTLLFMDGFDAGDYLEKWKSRGTDNYSGASSTTRYDRGRSMLMRWSHYLDQRLPPSPRVLVGFAFRIYGSSSDPQITTLGDSGSVSHAGLRVVNGSLGLYRSSTLIHDTGVTLEESRWYYIEAEITLADSGGVFRVWVDDVMVADFVGDTRNAGSSTLIDGVRLVADGNSASGAYFDDLYVLSVDGTAPNARLGEVSIQTLVPDGAGSLTEQIPVGSANNWQNVDNVPYSTSAYNYATADNTRDLYTATDALDSLPDVKGAAMNIIAARTDPGTGNVRSLLKTGAMIVNGPTKALTPNLAGSQDLLPTNPATGLPWTVAELNAIEIGSEVL